MKPAGPARHVAPSPFRPPRHDNAALTSSASVEELLAVLQSDGRINTEPPQTLVTVRFASELHSAISACSTLDDVRQAAADVLHQHASVEFVGWFTAGGALIGQQATLRGLTCNMADMDEQRQARLRSVAAQSGNGDAHNMVCVPVNALPHQAIVAILNSRSTTPDVAQQTAVALAAVAISEWQTQQLHAAALADSQLVAALVELVARIAACRSAATAGRCLVDELQSYLNAGRVALGQCRDGHPKCRLMAVSGLPDVDAFSEETSQTEAVLLESIARNTTTVWPAHEDSGRHALLSHQRFAQQQQSVAVVSTPLRTADGHCVGALVATFSDEAAAHEAFRFLFAGERSLAAAFSSADRSSQSVRGRLLSRVRSLWRGAAFRTAAVVTAVVTAMMFVPVDYRVTCEAEMQPVARRFVAAPFAAPLERCLVEPGDVVEVDQLLAVLDGRELRWELAGVRADLARAGKEHDAHLSRQEFGDAAITRHEIERLQNRSSLLTERTRNLEIRSPIAGVIVAGDLKEAEGVPLETGQSLFEVAPLDRMRVEVAVPEADMRHVAEGMPLALRLDAARSEVVSATIQQLHPAATLRDHDNVFIAEADVANEALLLRPGMKGTAAISTGPKALGWNLFHKPVAEVVGWLGW
ncbi:MAG: HlyD family efflux transporter periplasmic adaptor subunit [Planctomycetaceae bacterium]